jgi:hypothetical protein
MGENPIRVRGRCTALCVFALAISTQLRAQDATASPSYPRVEFDLKSGTFKQLLPFDTPFLLQTTAFAGTVAVEIQYQDEDGKRGRAWQPVPPLQWKRRSVDDVDATFVVRVPALDADRYYRFQFTIKKKLTDPQAKEFQVRAAEIIDRQLRLVVDGDLSTSDVELLRKDLIAKLKDVGAAESLFPGAGLFDPAAPPEAIATFTTFLQSTLQPQLDRAEALELSDSFATRLNRQLDILATDPQVAGLVANLKHLSESDAKIGALLQKHAVPLRVLESAPSARFAMARCVDSSIVPLTSTWPLAGTWDPAVAHSCSMRYGRTGDELKSIRDFAADSTVQVTLTPPDRAHLAQLSGDSGSLQVALDLVFSLGGQADQIERDLIDRQHALDVASSYTTALAREVFFGDASTTAGSDETRRSWYVSADAGFIYAWQIGTIVPYLGTNIYFRPVNKDVPLSQKSSLGRRFAVTVGMTLKSVKDARTTRKDLFSDQALLLGAGIRITQSIRLGAGALVFLRVDPNPLKNHDTVGATPYFAFSFDINVAKMIGKIF